MNKVNSFPQDKYDKIRIDYLASSITKEEATYLLENLGFPFPEFHLDALDKHTEPNS